MTRRRAKRCALEAFGDRASDKLPPCERRQFPVQRLALSRSGCKWVGPKPKIQSPDDVVRLVEDHYRDLPQEAILVLLMNNANAVVSLVELAVGGMGGAPVDPALLLGIVVSSGVPGFILVHNHPGGQREPSTTDEELTRSVKRGADDIRVRFLDHIIVTRDGPFYSFLNEGKLK